MRVEPQVFDEFRRLASGATVRVRRAASGRRYLTMGPPARVSLAYGGQMGGVKGDPEVSKFDASILIVGARCSVSPVHVSQGASDTLEPPAPLWSERLKERRADPPMGTVPARLGRWRGEGEGGWWVITLDSAVIRFKRSHRLGSDCLCVMWVYSKRQPAKRQPAPIPWIVLRRHIASLS